MKTRQISITVAIFLAIFFFSSILYYIISNFGADNIVNVTSNNNVVLNNHLSDRTITNITSNLNNMSNITNSTVQQINETANTIPGWALTLGFGGFAVLIVVGIFLPMWGLLPVNAPVNEAIEMGSDINFRHSNAS